MPLRSRGLFRRKNNDAVLTVLWFGDRACCCRAVLGRRIVFADEMFVSLVIIPAQLLIIHSVVRGTNADWHRSQRVGDAFMS